MEWNVFYSDFSTDKIRALNIFDHYSFYRSLVKLSKKRINKEEFTKRLRSELMYYFWCKSEYEILISPWIGNRDETIKVDIYTQVMLNWDKFVEYVWKNRKLLKAVEE